MGLKEWRVCLVAVVPVALAVGWFAPTSVLTVRPPKRTNSTANSTAGAFLGDDDLEGGCGDRTGLCGIAEIGGAGGGFKGAVRWEPTHDDLWRMPYNVTPPVDPKSPLGVNAPNGDPEKAPALCTARERPSWRFVGPRNCTYRLFTAERFCKLMGGRSLLLVGDSLQFEMYASLHFMLGGRTEQLCAQGLGTCARAPLYCGGRVNVTFIRHDWLAARDLRVFDKFGVNADHIGHEWMKQAARFDVVAVMVASHLVPRWTGNTSAAFWQECMQRTARFLASPAFGGVVVARGQPRGHSNCPTHSKTIPQEYRLPRVPGKREKGRQKFIERLRRHRWDLFGTFSKYFRGVIEELPESRRVWMHTEEALELRNDLHKSPTLDCLHYCLPGPPDLYNHAMLQALEEHKCKHPDAWRRRPGPAASVVEDVVEELKKAEPKGAWQA